MSKGLDSGVFIGEHKYCIASEFPVKANGVSRRDCSSSDALSIYEHEVEKGVVYYDAICWSCEQHFSREEVHSSSLAKELGVEPSTGKVKERVNFVNKASKKEYITKEERGQLWAKTGFISNSYRCLTDECQKFYGHRTELSASGKVVAQYYPETVDGTLVGYKSRHHPKRFGLGNLGKTGVSSDLSGQHKFPEGGKYVLICGGELDKVAAQIMLREYQKKKGQSGYNPYSVVSPTTGEPSAAKQCKAQYGWLDKHDIIIIGMDNDEVGNTSALEIAEVLPKHKVKIAKWSGKDPNAMLEEGKSVQFLSDFFSAKEYQSSGIFSSGELMPNILAALKRPRLTLPPHMKRLTGCTKGEGLIKGRIYNLIGDTSTGKTSHVNSAIHHWAFAEGQTPGVVSLEATNGEYGVDILSLHLRKNLYWEEEDKIEEYLNQPDVQEEANKLLHTEYGENRFYILDDREGTVASLQLMMERLYRQYGCTVIIVDVLTDLLRVLTNEQQAEHLNWQSNFVKNGCTIINVLHTRKPPPGRDGIPKAPSEYDALGSSIFVQKAAGNIVIYRNKEIFDTDPIESNTTYVNVPKMRQGQTGRAGAWFYDQETRQTYDRDDYFKRNPEKLPEGYDLTISSFDKEYWEEGGRGYKGEVGSSSYKSKSYPPTPLITVGKGVDL